MAAVGVALLFGMVAQTAHAQLPPGGYYADGAYYAPAAPGPATPPQDETAYSYGVYAIAPGFGPYLRLGGESGWNPNIGSTYNAYPPGDYYSDYGLPPPGPYFYGYYDAPVIVGGGFGAYVAPGYGGYWRWR